MIRKSFIIFDKGGRSANKFRKSQKLNLFRFTDLPKIWQFAVFAFYGPSIFCDLQICGFAICGLKITNLRICDFRTGTPQKFADLQLRNEPKNLRICDLWTKRKKFAFPPLNYYIWRKSLEAGLYLCIDEQLYF
jgi:hypothetical protein